MSLKQRLFKRSCREVSRLISESQERRLGWFDRTVLRLHMNVCDTCVRYEKQLQFMRRAMGRWKQYGDEP
jgi:hypothetical protein